MRLPCGLNLAPNHPKSSGVHGDSERLAAASYRYLTEWVTLITSRASCDAKYKVFDTVDFLLLSSLLTSFVANDWISYQLELYLSGVDIVHIFIDVVVDIVDFVDNVCFWWWDQLYLSVVDIVVIDIVDVVDFLDISTLWTLSSANDGISYISLFLTFLLTIVVVHIVDNVCGQWWDQLYLSVVDIVPLLATGECPQNNCHPSYHPTIQKRSPYITIKRHHHTNNIV